MTPPAPRPRPTARERLTELLLWAALVACGLFVLVPAAADLLRARQLEAAEATRDQRLRDDAAEAERALHWAVNDPLTDPRVLDTEASDLRNERTPPAPRDHE